MSATFDEIAREVVALPRQQRLALARILLDADMPAGAADAGRQWDEEIRARIRAVDEGSARAVDYDDLKKEVRTRFDGR